MNKLAVKTKELMRRFNIHPNKRLGQNFLIEQKVLDSIIAAGDVGQDDLVIEIGPGLGTLTEELCRKAGKVIAIELDRRFIGILDDVLSEYNNYKVVQGDILSLNLKELLGEINYQGDVKVIANLPYYITTPVIMKLLEEGTGIKSIVVMVQKEVAERITAGPGGKEYGALTIAVAFYGLPGIVLDVPPHSFIPEPEVYSSVIRIEVQKEPPIYVKDRENFFKIVRASFSQRRKTILNALSNSGLFGWDKPDLKQKLNSIGIVETKRPETLSISDYARIVNELI